MIYRAREKGFGPAADMGRYYRYCTPIIDTSVEAYYSNSIGQARDFLNAVVAATEEIIRHEQRIAADIIPSQLSRSPPHAHARTDEKT